MELKKHAATQRAQNKDQSDPMTEPATGKNLTGVAMNAASFAGKLRGGMTRGKTAVLALALGTSVENATGLIQTKETKA